MSDVIKGIANLSPQKRELLLQRLRQKRDNVSPQKIKPQPRHSSTFPLSFAQARLWFLEQLEPGNPFYNQSAAVHLLGRLNLAALEQSFNEILRRHEVLRTTFTVVEGQPVQVIAPTLPLTLPVVDLQKLPEAERKGEVLRRATQEGQQSFNLSEAPLLRCTLLRLDETEYVLLFTMHHIISDAWSKGVLLRELAILYEAFSTGKPSPLPELPIQYADFAVWQQQWLQGEVLETQLTYWRQQLEGSPPLLELPTDRTRPPVQTFRGATQSFILPKVLTEALKELSKQEDVTLFMTLLAVFKTLLYRYTGQNDILVGSPIANRNRSEIEGLIGFFVNTLVMRTNLGGRPSFRELLSRVRNVALAAYAHQDLPFERLVNELQLERDLSHTPLFQVMFEFGNTPISALALPGLTLSLLETESSTAKFDLSLSMRETEQGLIGSLEYNTDLFDAGTIAKMLGHFQTLVASILANPDQGLEDLQLLTDAEKQQLLVEWNDTGADYPQNQCIHQLFEAQVEQTPDAVAVVFEDQQLTYRELNTRANQLAHHLQKLGVKPEVLVGLCVERSLEMVVGVLGILKAGGAYVPLDPGYPQERLVFMLENANVPVLLTTETLVSRLPDYQAQVVYLDDDWQEISPGSDRNPLSQVTTQDLVYLIYTSGSTGKPKGVQILHSALVNFLSAMRLTPGLTQADTLLSVTPLSFDIAALELYLPLIVGARLVVVRREVAADGTRLLEQLASSGATIMQATPATWRMLLAAGWEGSGSLKILCGGETLNRELAIQLLERGTELWNLYGPTETTIWSTAYKVDSQKSDFRGGEVISIGRPIANTQLYVLDQDQQPVPVGIIGELHISGLGLARGYLNRAELTSEKFISNPFNGDPTSRLYKTGDLVRYRPDGTLEYISRKDYQVKIRGFRIELGEIEALLNQHPGVRETVVRVQEKVQGDKRLIAYIVTDQKLAPSINDLRRFLKQKLPDYMVPSVFVPLEALPLTPNGKVDRKALPAPDTARPELDKAFVAPRTPVETKLVEIWSQVLDVEQVGIYDNFFELGGDSILTIQIVARANQVGLQITPKQLFEHQNVADLAAVAVTKKTLPAEQGLVTGAVLLTPIQKWFFEQNLPEPHHFNQAVLLEVRQAIDLALLEQALRHLLLHHDALRLRFEKIESGWQQAQSSSDVSVPLTRWDFSALAEAEQNLAIEATATELQASLNLSTGLLMRVGFFDLGVRQPNRLLLVIHHLVVDGVSWRILLEDLQTAYQQLGQGEQVQLPAKTTSFQQWSQKLREYARSTALQQELDYWRRQSRKPSISLPVDFPRGGNTMASVGCVSSTLTFPETQALLKEVPQIYNTQINDVLLTALVQAFAQWTGERILLVDLEGHGREEISDDVDLSRTVGWFTTVFPVLLNLGEASNPGDALKEVKEQLRGIPNRGIGYGVLRYLSENQDITKQLSTLPQAEVIFNYLGQFDRTLSESSLFGLTQESSGLARSLRGKRCHLLEINGLVREGQLLLNWSYSEEVHRRSTIEALAQSFLEALQAIITHCQSPEAGGYTPSDFSEAQLSQQELDQFLAKINRRS